MNPPPFPNAPFILDKYGEKYWLDWNDFHCLFVSYRRQLVGRVNLSFRENGEIILADIIIFDNYSRFRSLRNRGLGKAMLREAIRHAKEHKGKFIWGWLEPDKHTTKEYLANWYERQGFKVNGENIYLGL